MVYPGKSTGTDKVKMDLREVSAPAENIMEIFALGHFMNIMQIAALAPNIIGSASLAPNINEIAALAQNIIDIPSLAQNIIEISVLLRIIVVTELLTLPINLVTVESRQDSEYLEMKTYGI
jgi:hypothetical protein